MKAKRMLLLVLAALIPVLLAACSNPSQVIPIDLGAQEGVTTDATGSFTVDFGESGFTVEGEFEGLTEAYSAGHVHYEDEAGTTLHLEPLDTTTSNGGLDGTFSATVSYDDIPEDVARSGNGQVYVNIHSSYAPGGEIFGNVHD